MVVMNSNCKRHLNALGIKQTIQADDYEPQLMKYALSPYLLFTMSMGFFYSQ